MEVKHKRLNLILLFGVFCWIASGCAPAAPQPPTAAAPTVALSEPITPPAPEVQPSTPTAQPMPSVTPLPTNTHTPAPTATQVPPPDDFSEAKLFSAAKLDSWNFSLTIALAQPIKGQYYALIGDPAKRYTCRPLVEYNHPERLFCSGRIPAVEKSVDYQILQESNDEPLFSGKIYIPL